MWETVRQTFFSSRGKFVSRFTVLVCEIHILGVLVYMNSQRGLLIPNVQALIPGIRIILRQKYSRLQYLKNWLF